jgi:hypothetical protein
MGYHHVILRSALISPKKQTHLVMNSKTMADAFADAVQQARDCAP